MYGYIYKTTNLVNGKIYIGQHKSIKFTKEYIGSGKYLSYAIAKYGRDNFDVELLESAETKSELNFLERKWISKFNSTNREVGYNLTQGGDGGDTFSLLPDEDKLKAINRRSSSLQGRVVSEETRQKISKKGKGRVLSEETRKKISQKRKGQTSWLKGKHLSEEQKRHLSIKCSGWHHSDEAKQKISNKEKGRRLTEEWKQHQRHPHKRKENNNDN